ncbi:hypothetical protein [Flectobacillus major]|jgi:hypothetical protein|uniref:hypothetical protein n=1 Tax=Flectobacillus major TaxID=103 RepID=UPI0004270E0F|nr:hypothetical protein [Flectobacillus major]
MFYFRINKLKIYDNREKRKFLGIIGKDLAQVKLISFVSTEFADFPDFSDFIQTNDATEKQEIIKRGVESVIGSRILTEIENVKDGHQMTFGDTGFVLYQSKAIPESFDWQFIAYESDKNIRDTATMVNDILTGTDLNKFAGNLSTIIKNVPNPTFTASIAITNLAINTIAQVAKKNKDDMIGILMMSLNRREHYLHGERKRDDVPDLTNNMMVDYSIFAFDE